MYKKPRYCGDYIYKVCLFSLCLLYNVLAPYNAPAAIRMLMPPSIGTQGGGQQPGPPDGGGGAATDNELTNTINNAVKINFVLINVIIKT